MKNLALTTTGIALLLLGFISGCHAQMGNNITKTKVIKDKDFEFNINVSKKEFQIGKTIELNVSFKNNFFKTVALPYMNYDLLTGYSIVIMNSNGKVIPQTKTPELNRGFGSRLAIEVSPGLGHKSTLQIENYYDLPVGKYQVYVTHQVKGYGKLGFVLVKSNSINLTVVK